MKIITALFDDSTIWRDFVLLLLYCASTCLPNACKIKRALFISISHTSANRFSNNSVLLYSFCTTVWAFDPTNVYSHIFLKHPLVQVLREDGLFALVAWEQWRYIYMQNVRLWEKAPLPYAPPLSAGDIFRNWSHFLLSAASLYSPFSYFCGDKIHY